MLPSLLSMEMSCSMLCGFIDFRVTVPALAVALVVVYARPVCATSISTVWAAPPELLIGVVAAGALDELLLPPPQPAARSTAPRARTSNAGVRVLSIGWLLHRLSGASGSRAPPRRQYRACKDSVCLQAWR